MTTLTTVQQQSQLTPRRTVKKYPNNFLLLVFKPKNEGQYIHMKMVKTNFFCIKIINLLN